METPSQPFFRLPLGLLVSLLDRAPADRRPDQRLGEVAYKRDLRVPEAYPPYVHQAEDLSKVTLAHLRDPDGRCALRLSREFENERASTGANIRFRLSGRLEESASLAQTSLDAPRLVHFPTPRDFLPEERGVFSAAARWYVEIFGDRNATSAGTYEFSTPRRDLGINLVGGAGLRFITDAGLPEIRILQYAGRSAMPETLFDSPEVRFSMLRNEEWIRATGSPILVTVADLIRGEAFAESLSPDPLLLACNDWLVSCVERIRERVRDPRPEMGTDCAWCGFISSCDAVMK